MLNPLGNRLLLQYVVEEKIGVIFLPENSKKPSKEAVVVRVGPKCCPEIQAAKKVILSAFAGQPIKDGGKDYLLVSEDDVLGILEE